MAGSMASHLGKSMSSEMRMAILRRNIVPNAFHTHFDGSCSDFHFFFFAFARPQTIYFIDFRLSTKPCDCEYHSLCDTYQKAMATASPSDAAATVASSKQNPLENPSLCEMENVHKVYNEIANHFSETRHSPWPQVNEFIRQFEMGSILVDIGCGNGKYLQSNRNIFEVIK